MKHTSSFEFNISHVELLLTLVLLEMGRNGSCVLVCFPTLPPVIKRLKREKFLSLCVAPENRSQRPDVCFPAQHLVAAAGLLLI